MQTKLIVSAMMLMGLCAGVHAAGSTPTQSAIELSAEGVQIYTCKSADTGASWVLKAPDATLRDAQRQAVVHHFAGPTWQWTDGSSVVGEPVSVSPAPQAGAVAWLVLHAKSHAGSGMLANVDYVARVHTEGGVAPATGCDASHVGAEVRVPYKATYLFFRH
ncbi:MAG TPA: DUF3455 domain-containing protein [Dyella sp.]|uniref:DUF3455 domain-containing protein n=1 Tax=Dyella sp. TaxID=1869338 RepID=UPI002F9519E8